MSFLNTSFFILTKDNNCRDKDNHIQYINSLFFKQQKPVWWQIYEVRKFCIPYEVFKVCYNRNLFFPSLSQSGARRAGLNPVMDLQEPYFSRGCCNPAVH